MRGLFFLASIVSVALSFGCSVEAGNDFSTSTAIVPDFEISVGHAELKKLKSGEYLFRGLPLSGYLLEHDQSGILRSRRGYFDGFLEGDYLLFYPSGDTAEWRNYSQGRKHGRHVGFHSNGNQKFEFFFDKGKAIGTHRQWYADGTSYMLENYNDAGKPFGLQRVWRPDGKLRSNFVVKEDGRSYGLVGLKRCTKIDSETKYIDPYEGS
ncbi:toxin-antitoxin system YwqK family antitoxin [Reichenbachiella ulvae]|uniref:Toxin-antitoxin system YwqK family antitoxin n=1 Tax=Reichenbachiella ulvae TaxID=2980104 RepID=A0ABT3CY07_9BACT|nr:hypothetical protein [Reichenbachiella ulvae]MCV9388580.1 hypothetical protein [Reichenbachiella ulvae]